MIAQAVGLGAAVDYLAALGMERVRAHEQALTAHVLEGLRDACRGVRVVGPPERRERGGAGVLRLEGIHPHDIAELLGRAGRLRARRPPLRAAADAPARRRRDGARELRPLQRRRPTSTRWSTRSARARRREVFGRVAMDDLYRDFILEHYKHPRNFGELEPARPRGARAQPALRRRARRADPRRRTAASPTCASRATAARSRRPPPRSPPRS